MQPAAIGGAWRRTAGPPLRGPRPTPPAHRVPDPPGPAPGRSVPGGILDLRPGPLDVARGLVGRAFGPQAGQRAGGPGHVIAEHRERVGERMAAAAIGQDAGHAGDHRRDQDDKPDNY